MDIVIGANHKQKCDDPKCLQKKTKNSKIKSSALYSTAPQPVYSRLGKSHVCICVAGVVVSADKVHKGPKRKKKSFFVSRQAPLGSCRFNISLFLHLQFSRFRKKELKFPMSLTTKIQIRAGLITELCDQAAFPHKNNLNKKNKALLICNNALLFICTCVFVLRKPFSLTCYCMVHCDQHTV